MQPLEHGAALASTSREVSGRLATSRLGAASFRLAGAALGVLPERSAEGWRQVVWGLRRFAWQVQHLEHFQRGQRKAGDDSVVWALSLFACHVQHLEHLSLILRGRCSTWSTSREVSERLANDHEYVMSFKCQNPPKKHAKRPNFIRI